MLMMKINATEKKYSPEQLTNTEELAKSLSKLTPDKQAAVTMIANAFIAGMEAQSQLVSNKTN